MKKLLLTTLALCFILPHFAHADITTGMFGYWKLNEGFGTTAADSSGNSNDGTLTNSPTWATTGHITANDLQYTNGLTTYVGTLNAQDTSSSFTWAEWVQPTGFTGVPSVHISTTQGIQFGTDNSGQIIFNDALGTNYATGVTLTANVWVHLAAVCIYSGGSTDELHIYKNGVEIYASTGIIGGCGLLSAGSITLGQDGTNPSLNDGLDGYQQEVRVYNRALTASDITELFNYGTLILHYALEDNAATTVVVDSQALSNGTASTNTSNLHVAGHIGTGAFQLASSSSQGVNTNYSWSPQNNNATLSAWVNYQFFSGTGEHIISNYNAQAGELVLNGSNNNRVECLARDNAGHTSDNAATSTNVGDLTWHMLTCVLSGTTMRGYVDGKQVLTATVATLNGNYQNVTGSTFFLGREANAAGFFTGKIDDVCIYNRALSTADVVSLYNSASGCGVPAPVIIFTSFIVKLGTAFKVMLGAGFKTN